MDFIWNLLFFVILIGILVTVHEYGHFIVARKCGVQVIRFAIGFGKPLVKWFDKQGTEYVIAAIPLGGYVKMLDTRLGEVDESCRSRAFNLKPVQQRIAIVAAGPIFNFLFTIVAFWLISIIGFQAIKPVIGETEPDSIAYHAELPKHAELIKINEQTLINWQDAQLALSSLIGDSNASVTYRTELNGAERHSQLDLSQWQPEPEKESLITSIGIKPYRPEITLNVAIIQPNSPASHVLLENDKITAINDTELQNWLQFTQLIRSLPGADVTVKVVRNGESIELFTQLGVRTEPNGEKIGFIGIVPRVEPWPKEYVQFIQYDILSAIPVALEKTWHTISLSFAMVGKLITGDVSLNSLSGPVSIAKGAGTTASYGVVNFLNFMAFISVSLGIINLLPLPVLDGGHLLYFLIELVRGKPVPEHIQEIGFKIGLVFIISLMSIAFFNDLARL
ncbi:sigma E protease regulator RseP [Algibacillus agarilyticus]|uniref:sigma E protease regulator RseP n=1 Tax=Algibacillus agarilyticus TaxID=2234133 RepID=UPI000DD0C862|nr:sigma E protease regulator RseP [Algibacillus agarilyticus]